MKLRRRIIKYFILLILFTSVVNLGISYYLTQTSWDRFHDVIRSTFLEKTIDNLISMYESTHSLALINESDIRPKELVVQLPHRFGREGNNQFSIPIGQDNGWGIIVADEKGQIIIGGDKVAMGQIAGNDLISKGKYLGTIWLVEKNSIIGELMRNYLLIPLLFRNFLTVLVSCGLALGIAFMFSDYLAKHISELALAARNIAGGKLDYRMKIGAKDELGELAADFNKMAEKLQEDQGLRRQFQADVVHELRTPLAVCQAVLDSLESGVVNWDSKILASLQEETNRMNRLVTDLHELNRVDNQQLPLYKELFSIRDLVERLQESFVGLAQNKKIDFTVEMDDDVLCTILYADPDRIMQIFLNLLHNSLRHTSEGGTVTLKILPKDNTQMTFTVSDTGEGIPSELLPYIFDRFISGEKSRSRQRSGTGLGLAIAKEYTLLHGGSIEVKSVLFQGTEFILTLPIEKEMTNEAYQQQQIKSS